MCTAVLQHRLFFFVSQFPTYTWVDNRKFVGCHCLPLCNSKKLLAHPGAGKATGYPGLLPLPSFLSRVHTYTLAGTVIVLYYASSCLKWLIALFFREQGYRGCESKQLGSNQLSAPFEELETITEINGAAQRWLTA